MSSAIAYRGVGGGRFDSWMAAARGSELAMLSRSADLSAHTACPRAKANAVELNMLVRKVKIARAQALSCAWAMTLS